MPDRLFDDVDISSMEFWSSTPRHRDEAYSVLRRDRPVSWHRPVVGLANLSGADATGFWAVVDHDLVKAVSKQTDAFQSGQGIMMEDVPEEVLEAASSFLAMDHPRHTALRRLVSTAFTPRRVKLLEEAISAQAAALVDNLLAEPSGDFIETVAKPLPSGVFASMMGVDATDREHVTGLANDMVAWNDPDALKGRDGLTLLLDTLVGLYAFASTVTEARRAEPKDDLLTGLVNAEVDGQRLTDEEIAAFFTLLSVAANDTTRQTISQGMRVLTQNPEQLALLASDLERYLPGAVEEMVRWATPVMTFRRTAVRDVELAGVQIAQGEKVVMFYASANRDEKVFTDPWTFDITRTPNEHLGFGGGGPHFCLGASLARTMLSATFTELIGRAPQLQLGDPKWLVGNFVQGFNQLPYNLAS
jgi:cytochrome P450